MREGAVGEVVLQQLAPAASFRPQHISPRHEPEDIAAFVTAVKFVAELRIKSSFITPCAIKHPADKLLC